MGMFPFHDMDLLLDEHRRRIENAERLALAASLRRASRTTWRARLVDAWRRRRASRGGAIPQVAPTTCTPAVACCAA